MGDLPAGSMGYAHEAARRGALDGRPARQAAALKRAQVWLPFRVRAEAAGAETEWVCGVRERAARRRLSWAAWEVGDAERAVECADRRCVAGGVMAVLPPVLQEALRLCLRLSPAFTQDGLYLAAVLGCGDAYRSYQVEAARLEARLRRLAAHYVCRYVAGVDAEDVLDPHPAAGCPVGRWRVVHTEPVGVVGGQRWWRAVMWRFIPSKLCYDTVRDGFVVREGGVVAAGRTRREALAELRGARRANAAALL